jgi:hypothetical protein
MRQWVKSVLRRLWRLTSPLRRPIFRKLDSYLAAQLQRQLKPMGHDIAEQGVELRDLGLCAENTIRELIRLQLQLEAIQFTTAVPIRQAEEDWMVTAPETAPGKSSQAA